MEPEKKCPCGKDQSACVCRPAIAKGAGGGFYFLGMVGALVYYIQNAATFGQGVLGILKALVWPKVHLLSDRHGSVHPGDCGLKYQPLSQCRVSPRGSGRRC